MTWLSRWFGWLVVAVTLLVATPAVAQDLVAPKDEAFTLAPPPVPDGWETVPGLTIEVSGHAEELPVLMKLARYGSKSLPKLADRLGVPIGGVVHVYVAANDDEFRRLQPGRPPEWADATAWPDRDAVFLRSLRARGNTDRPLQVVFDHELVHVLLGRAFAPHNPPRWLQEGMAQFLAGEVDPDTTRAIAKGMAGRGLFKLNELAAGFPKDPDGAKLAYAQSADLVAYIDRVYGDDALVRLVRALHDGKDIDGAIYLSTGRSIEEVDLAWRAELYDGPPLWLSAVGGEDAIWIATGVLGAVALARAWWKSRGRLAEYAAREREREALLRRLWENDDIDGPDQRHLPSWHAGPWDHPSTPPVGTFTWRAREPVDADHTDGPVH